jgi:hypothetical protein
MEMNMKSMSTVGILLVQAGMLVSACSSDKDPTSESTTAGGAGGGTSLRTNIGGTTAASSGGSSASFGTGGTTGISSDASNSDAASDSSVPNAVPSIVGVYTDGFFEHRITADTWYMDTSIFHITIVNNSDNFLIALADSTNLYSPSLWNRFDWNIDGSKVLRICETTYNAATEQQALDTPAADAQDFAKGCGGFAWSVLTPIQIGDAGADAGH